MTRSSVLLEIDKSAFPQKGVIWIDKVHWVSFLCREDFRLLDDDSFTGANVLFDGSSEGPFDGLL
jgi:hypothetical protein